MIQRLTNRTFLALLGIGVVLCASYAMFLAYAKRAESDGAVINLSGRQRMLSQNVVRLVLEERQERDPRLQEELRERRRETLHSLEEAHRKLTDSASRWPRLRELYFGDRNGGGLDAETRDFISLFRDSSARDRQSAFIVGDFDAFVGALDRAVARFEEEAGVRNRRIVGVQSAVLLFGLSALTLLGVFVFRPLLVAAERDARTLVDLNRQLDQRLRESENRLAVSLEAGQIGYWEWDVSAERIFVSEALKRSLDLPAGSAPLLDEFMDRIHPEDVSEFKLQVLQSVQAERGHYHTFRVKGRDGAERWFLGVGRSYAQSGKLPTKVIGTVVDITEQKMAERTIAEQQAKILSSAKMSSLGEMASGIAHEINTPLASISVLSSQLRELLSENPLDRPTLDSHAEKIERMVDRIGKIIRGLRTFSRDATRDPFTPVEIRDVVEDVLSLCQERFALTRIRIEVSLPDEPVRTLGRSAQLSQVLLNLLNNSYDAISELAEKWIKLEVTPESSRFQVRITDSGPGIPAEVRERLFQPFFTTKEIGKGTGIGLNISKNILEQHGGGLTINPDCRNTQFILFLPREAGGETTRTAA